jgi:hypothetical protein
MCAVADAIWRFTRHIRRGRTTDWLPLIGIIG